MAHIDVMQGSYSSVDVDKVDVHKYPGLGKVPWWRGHMEAGDCFYIPFQLVQAHFGLSVCTGTGVPQSLALHRDYVCIPSHHHTKTFAGDVQQRPSPLCLVVWFLHSGRWFHQVRSSGRNLAVNIWWVPVRTFNKSDCYEKVGGKEQLKSLSEYASLSRYGFSPGEHHR